MVGIIRIIDHFTWKTVEQQIGRIVEEASTAKSQQDLGMRKTDLCTISTERIHPFSNIFFVHSQWMGTHKGMTVRPEFRETPA